MKAQPVLCSPSGSQVATTYTVLVPLILANIFLVTPLCTQNKVYISLINTHLSPFKHLPFDILGLDILGLDILGSDILGMIPRRILDSLIIHVTSLQVQNILKYLFPVPKEDSKRVVTFANQEDYISFR